MLQIREVGPSTIHEERNHCEEHDSAELTRVGGMFIHANPNLKTLRAACRAVEPELNGRVANFEGPPARGDQTFSIARTARRVPKCGKITDTESDNTMTQETSLHGDYA